MASSFGDIKPTRLWKHFEDIMKIPHCSGNEEALGEHIMAFAKGLGLESRKDKVGNVLVRKPATAGREKAEGVILQGHLDMVGEKNSDVNHDFAKDPIQGEIKGEWIQARGTTLGADNGIALAAGMAVMEDTSLVHGPLEFLFTVDEETGLTGANNLSKHALKGSRLLNLDSEEEGTFTIGCAGGADTIISLPLKRKTAASRNLYRLKVKGFRGGHSGMDINQGRGNAVKLLARLLFQAQKEYKFSLTDCQGGNKRNAIAREAWAVLSVNPADAKGLASFLKKSFDKIRIEYKAVETDAAMSFEKVENGKEFPLTPESQNALLGILVGLPHGVMSMHPEIKSLVETSTNLAIVQMEKKSAKIICSTRSSIASCIEATRNMIEAIVKANGGKAELKDGYPGWMPNLQSPLLAIMKVLHKKVTGKNAEVMAIHAGLECGLIGEKYPKMDMISFGPTIEHPHSPDERVHIASVERFWNLLAAVLSGLS